LQVLSVIFKQIIWFNTDIQALALKYAKTIPQLIFKFALQIGILPLTGTTDLQHMQDDLRIHDFDLTVEEVQNLETGLF